MSFSTNSSSSSSTPTFLETPENSIIDQISSTAQGLAGQMLNWANGVFAQTSQVTNQAVGNFFAVSQKMMGLSNNLTDQYNNLFAPENAQLVADANSYASPARMAVDMGQAGATQAQAGDQALKNSEEALRSYGINPADGRYAALDKAAAVQNAANIAGAENTQRNADIATGQRLRSEAVQVGAQLPAAIANVNNTALQANTGASNASLANANTGRNLMSLPNDFLKTAMDVKLPPTGQNSQSSSNGFSSSPSRDSGGGGSRSGGGGPGGGSGSLFGPSGPAWMPQHNPNAGNSQGGSGGRTYNVGPGSHVMQLDKPGPNQPDAQTLGSDGNWPDGTTFGQGSFQPDFTDPFQDYGSGTDYGAGAFGNSYGQDWGNGNTFDSGSTGTFTGDQVDNFGGQTDFGGGSDMSGFGAYNYDPSANQASGWGNGDAFSGDNSGYDPSVFSGGGSDFSAPAFQDYGGGANTFGQDYSTPDYGSYTPPSDDYDMGGAYAAGGPIPASASPSRGARVDDIPAQGPGGRPLRMNANEFVIPQDVALWKGQEFFQNLIDQSRKKRMGASAQPKQMPVR